MPPSRRRFTFGEVRGNLPGGADGALSLLAWRTAVEKRVWREENLRVTFSGGLGEWHFEPWQQHGSRQTGKNQSASANRFLSPAETKPE
jgi:hypothetical protein